MSHISVDNIHPDDDLCARFSKDTILYDDISNNSSERCRQVNLEMHQLIWLDPDGKVSMKSLRNIVDYTRIFDNCEDCSGYIKQTPDTSTYLVCTEKLAQELLPRVHHLNSILKIYVLLGAEHEQKIFSDYFKVTEVNKESVHVLDMLSVDVHEHKKHVDFIGSNRIEMTTDNYGSSWWSGVIDLIVALPYPKESCHKFVKFLRVYYEGKTSELNILAEFEADYQSNKAIWWYTRPTFFFGLLNKALRQHNIEVMFLLGFFVRDLYEQLKSEYEIFKATHPPIIKSYRGQILHVDEIKRLKIGDNITNNSFLSTSLHRHLALIFQNFLLKPDDQFQNVLFEFEIDARQQAANPWADITSCSFFSEEAEVLFMIGCKFEIQDIVFDENEKYWHVKVDLDYAYKSNKYIIDQSSSDNTFRRVLNHSLSQFITHSDKIPVEDIDTLFKELTELFPSEERWISAIKLDCLANRQFEKSPYYAESISLFEQALDIWSHFTEDDELNCSLHIGEIHMMMSVCYESRFPMDKNLAMRHCDSAISYIRLANEKACTDYEKIDTMNELVNAYSCKMHISNNTQENAPMIIQYLELAIEQMLKYYSKNDLMIISRIEKLATCFVSINKYDDALKYYEKALEIYLQQSKPPLNWIISTYERIANIYIKYKHDYHAALRYQLNSHQYALRSHLLQRTDSPNNIDNKKDVMASSYEKLAIIYIHLNQCHLAYTNLMAASKLHEEIVEPSPFRDTIRKMAKLQITLANVSLKLHQYDLACEHLDNTLHLCQGRSKLDSEQNEVAVIDIRLADTYTQLKQYNQADQHLARAMNIYQKIYDFQYQCKIKLTTVRNGRIQRHKQSNSILYVTKNNRTCSCLVLFLDSKMTNASDRVLYREIRRLYIRRK